MITKADLLILGIFIIVSFFRLALVWDWHACEQGSRCLCRDMGSIHSLGGNLCAHGNADEAGCLTLEYLFLV